MGGPLNMSVDHLVGNNGTQLFNLQEYFVVAYNFLNTQFTRIASNYGVATGGLDALGFDFFDAGSGHAGRNAWAIFRTNGTSVPAFNIVLEWRESAGGDWTLAGSISNDGIGIGGAIVDDGSDAWTGGTADVGADATADPRWSIGAGSELFTFNYENEAPGGTQFTNKEDLLRASGQIAATTSRSTLHMWADDDGVLFVFDDTINGSPNATYLGAYDPLAGNTQENAMPVIGVAEQNSGVLRMGTGFGIYGIGSAQEAGGLLPLRGKASGDVPGFYLDDFADSYAGAAWQPNNQLDVKANNMRRVGVLSASGSQTGHCGYLPTWIRNGYNLPINARNNNTPDRAFFAVASQVDRGIYPWHPGGPPGSVATRAGVQATWNGP
jgi:hypothetical protein